MNYEYSYVNCIRNIVFKLEIAKTFRRAEILRLCMTDKFIQMQNQRSNTSVKQKHTIIIEIRSYNMSTNC
jgi:hypothetical protein